MHRTLLLCFIHGFKVRLLSPGSTSAIFAWVILIESFLKGGDDTFAAFPQDLSALVSHALPNITIKAVTYPKFETRGDLKECVGRFREW